MQNHYNLIYREEEREMIPYCASTGVGLMPWSPLARGILAGSYRGGFDAGSTERSKGLDRVRTEGLYRGDADFKIADRVIEVADRLGHTPAQIALAWLLSKPEVAAPWSACPRCPSSTSSSPPATIVLDPADVAYLEELYQPLQNLLSIGSS